MCVDAGLAALRKPKTARATSLITRLMPSLLALLCPAVVCHGDVSRFVAASVRATLAFVEDAARMWPYGQSPMCAVDTPLVDQGVAALLGATVGVAGTVLNRCKRRPEPSMLIGVGRCANDAYIAFLAPASESRKF